MKTEEQVWTVLVETNPVPDVNQYGRDEVGGAAYLATIEQGMDEMIDTEPDTAKDTSKGRRGIWMATAAIAAVVLAVAVLPNLGSDDAVNSTAPAFVTMEFEDEAGDEISDTGDEIVVLTAELDECPLELLRNQETVEWELEGKDQTGQVWTMTASLHIFLAGDFKFGALHQSDGSPNYRAEIGGPMDETIGETSATYEGPYYDASTVEGLTGGYHGITTIECAG